MFGKELFIQLTLRVLSGRLSVCVCASFPFGFEGGMWDLNTVDSRYLELEGTSKTLRDIRTSTYQIFRIEENTNRTTKYNE